MVEKLSAEALADRTYFWERIRSLFTGFIEIIWQPGAAVALLVAIRHFELGTVPKSIISASGPIGFLLTPLSLSLFAHSRLPIQKAMALLFILTGLLLFLIPWVPGAMAYVVLVSLAHIVMVQYTPMYTEMYSNHFTTTQRGHRISTVFIIAGAVSVVANIVAGELLDFELGLYKHLMVMAAICCGFSAWSLWQIPSDPLLPEQVGHPLKNLSLAWRDKLFGWLLSSWMLLGFGNLMTLPLRTEYMANPRFGIDASNQMILFITGAVPLLCRLLASRMLGKMFDRWNLVKLRMMLNILFLVSVLLFFSTTHLWVMGISMALLGTAMAGGRIAWSLWVTKLAGPGQTSAYMSVHMFMTGLRGTLAPFIGFALIECFSAKEVSWMGVSLIVLSTLMFLPAVGHMHRRGEELEK
ncbi:MFS transporter [Kiritimatiellaeota bacterium B1221]|nr:MFS transporter [Kiritimatiellaeota bacterium B1221]